MQLILEQGDMGHRRDAVTHQCNAQVQTPWPHGVSRRWLHGLSQEMQGHLNALRRKRPCKRLTSSNLPPQVDAADNMDLLRIVQEYEETYESRYDRRPKLTRRLIEEVAGGGGGMRNAPAGAGRAPARMPSPVGDRAGVPAAG